MFECGCGFKKLAGGPISCSLWKFCITEDVEVAQAAARCGYERDCLGCDLQATSLIALLSPRY